MSLRSPALVHAPHRPADLLLRDVHLFDPRVGLDARHDVLVRAGAIAELAPPGTLVAGGGGVGPAVAGGGVGSDDGMAAGDGGTPTAGGAVEVVEGRGRHLLPAFFDPHVHLRSPGQEHREDIDSGTRAAAAGGFGAVIAMPNTDPPIDSPALLDAVRATAASQAHVPVGFLAAITVGLEGERLTEMVALREGGALGFTDDGHPVADTGLLREALRVQRELGVEELSGGELGGGVLALHEEDRSLSRGGSMREGPVSAALGIPGVPCASECTMVARDATLAGCEGGRVHFQHLSCVPSVEVVAAAKTCGAPVSAEATPHHLLLTEADVRGAGGEGAGGEANTRMKMNPPLGTEADRRALVEGLRAGTIECVATDHAPHARAEKALPFAGAPMGTTGLETAFAALYTGLVAPGVLGLGVLVERMTAGAALFGLPVARIAVGEPANLTLVDLRAEWVAGEHGWESRSESCCFAGRRLRGRVLLTLAAGAVAYRAPVGAVAAVDGMVTA
jgi:dihydroorotase